MRPGKHNLAAVFWAVAAALAAPLPCSAAIPKASADARDVAAHGGSGAGAPFRADQKYRMAPSLPRTALANDWLAQSRPQSEPPRAMVAASSDPPAWPLLHRFAGWFDVQQESRLYASILFLLGAAVWTFAASGRGRTTRPAALARPSTS